jgi:hypothetical protein
MIIPTALRLDHAASGSSAKHRFRPASGSFVDLMGLLEAPLMPDSPSADPVT